MQRIFSGTKYAAMRRQTRRDWCPADIETATPWAALVSVIDLHYPKVEGRGRRPIGCERM